MPIAPCFLPSKCPTRRSRRASRASSNGKATSPISLSKASFPEAIKLKLKYQGKKSIIEGLRRISTPGLRRYVGATDIPRVRGGLGVAVVSTSEGLLTDLQARKKKIGGELICYVW